MTSPPTAVNLELLIKLLKLTTSSHDGEALAAIRAANLQLAKVGGDWETLLRGKVTIIADPWSGQAAAPTAAPTAAPNEWKPQTQKSPIRPAPPWTTQKPPTQQPPTQKPPTQQPPTPPQPKQRQQTNWRASARNVPPASASDL